MRALIVAAALGLAPSAHAQTPTTTCNDQTRQLTTAGGTSSTSAACPTWSITVSIPPAVNGTYSSPTSCDTGRTVRSSDCFDCGPASAGNHCKARGFKVNVKVYSIGGGNACPEIPSSLPTTVAQLNAVLACKDLPKTSDTPVWCALVLDCANGKVVSSWADQEQRVLPEGPATVRLGDPDALLGPPRVRPFAAQLAAAQSVPIAELHPTVSAAWIMHAPLSGGVELTADVERTFENVPGHGTVVNRHSVAGTVLAGGKFALSDTRRVQNEDQSTDLLTEELAYDGGNFFCGVVGAPFYDAYSSTSLSIDNAMAGLGFVEPLLNWVDSPFAILRFAGTHYADEQVDGSAGARLRVLETYPGVPLNLDKGQTLYEIEIVDGVPRPVRIAISNSQGALLVERLFSDYRTLGADVWRPFQLTERRFNAGATTPYVTTTVSFRRTRLLDSAEAATAWRRPQSENNWWIVRT